MTDKKKKGANGATEENTLMQVIVFSNNNLFIPSL
jgi:hypothetical protein